MITDEATITRIRDHAARIYPEECCGFLIGTLREDGTAVVVDAEPVENVREELKERRYQIAPADLFRAETKAAEAGYDVVGFYHSHPDHPAEPSATDLAEATFPGYAYVIVSVTRGVPGTIRSWSLRDDRTGFDEQSTEIIADKLEIS
jgi:proteasome lid subunit RPN8/RPN11